ncbi:MAG: hypothetical protein IT562_08190 [Alphaproteobacteria bacterium]|nr:hypothetical protein [Alphaproteobacteria bacterium]
MALLVLLETVALLDYAWQAQEYPFPLEGYEWAYKGHMNYLLTLLGSMCLAILGLTLCARTRKSGNWVYLAICGVAIAFDVLTPDWCDQQQWIHFPKSAC